MLLLSFWWTGGYAQRVGTWLRFAEEAKAEGDHHEAVGYLRKALEGNPERTDIRYELAHALRRSKLYEKALEQYQKVQEEDRRGEQYPKCLLYLAQMQMHMGQYREAGRSWGNLKRRYIRQKDSYLYRKAAQGSKASDWAQKAMEDSSDRWVDRMRYPINTIGSEFAPTILQDSLFYFTVLRAEEENQDGTIKGPEPRSKILVAPSLSQEKDSSAGDETVMESRWGKPRTAREGKDDRHVANSCFTDDGKTMIFSQCREEKGEKICKLYRTQKKGGEWQKPKALSSRIAPDSFNTTHPAVSTYRGKEVLFFSSDRSGTRGKMDIWWVPRKGVGEYGKVQNAGDSINSVDNEVTPFYLSEEEALYFASDWHIGFGGFDLFKSEGKKNGLGSPQNLGRPINSPSNDLYPFIDVERSKGFFASNRKGSREGWVGMCCHDIYHWPVEIQPNTDTLEVASVEDLNRFLPVTLYFHNDRPDPNTLDTNTDKSYDASYRDYKERVPTYVRTYAKGRSDALKDSAKKRMQQFFDQRVDKGIKDLSLFAELLLKELKKGQDIELTIKGYASPLAETEYNVHLTKRRIGSLINYLREYGDGDYIHYLEGKADSGGSLSFVSKPYGEYSADTVVSDELRDKQESVYSVSAALERKIEIERVKQVRKDSNYAELTFDKGVLDLGQVQADSSYEQALGFRNEGKDSLRIDSSFASSDELEIELSTKILAPEEKGELKIRLTPSGSTGKQVRSIIIHSNGISREKKISVTYELRDQR